MSSYSWRSTKGCEKGGAQIKGGGEGKRGDCKREMTFQNFTSGEKVVNVTGARAGLDSRIPGRGRGGGEGKGG